jgi:galactokinase
MCSALFESYFGEKPKTVAIGHGRANLIGEHTDYNDGLVMPVLLRHHTVVALSTRNDNIINGVSDRFGAFDRPVDSQCDGSWLDFVTGALSIARCKGFAAGGEAARGINIAVSSNVPAGAGVSSSAAFEIALLRALGALAPDMFDNISPADLARMGQQIEHDYVGTACGIMDQMVAAIAPVGQAMLLDVRSMETRCMPLFAGHDFLVIHSGVTRKLSEGAYNERLAQCRKAANQMGVSSLRNADLVACAGLADPLLQKRARHVISENIRVQDAAIALKTGKVDEFGQLMDASHASLDVDYGVSSPTLNSLVANIKVAGAIGARLTGAGFGGCVIALCAREQGDYILDTISSANPNAWLVDRITGL